MIQSSIKNASFKKMLVSAMKGHHHSSVKHGVTAANMPSQMKKALHEIKVNGVAASKYIHMGDSHKVTRNEAYQVMKGLKEKGLAHHMQTTDTHHYVNRGFEHEHAVQQQIKKQNLEQNAKQMAQDRMKAQQTGVSTKKGPQTSALQGGATPVHSAWSSAPVKKSGPSSNHTEQNTNHIQVGHVTGSALTGAQWHAHEAPAHLPTESGPEHHSGGSISSSHHEEETIDLAID